MALDTLHPLYVAHQDDWKMLRDAHSGERAVKLMGQLYLPATSGMQADGMSQTTQPGWLAYDAYRKRAVFPDFVAEGVGHMLGIMHARPAKIDLPSALEPMREAASSQGESLQHLLMRINEEQLITGRVGLLVDMPEVAQVGAPRMFLSLYSAESIRNWDENLVEADRTVLNLVVLDESRYERQPSLEWQWQERYRVLSLGEIGSNESRGVYGQALTRTREVPSSLSTPTVRGMTISRIPFTMINAVDNLTIPDRPPLLGLARICMTIYRGEADYRQNLFMQGQDTLVTIGAPDTGDDGERVGAGAILNLPTGAEAKYIGVNSQGLSEQRQALEKDYAMGAQRAGQLATAKSKQIESGEALQTRIASVTANLTSIAKAGARGLEQALRNAAEWVGANPDEVKVEPNTQFHDLSFNPRDMVELISAKTMGMPLSNESIHEVLRERGYTRKTYEEELASIEGEEPLTVGTMAALPPSGGDFSGGSSQAAGSSGAN